MNITDKEKYKQYETFPRSNWQAITFGLLFCFLVTIFSFSLAHIWFMVHKESWEKECVSLPIEVIIVHLLSSFAFFLGFSVFFYRSQKQTIELTDRRKREIDLLKKQNEKHEQDNQELVKKLLLASSSK